MLYVEIADNPYTQQQGLMFRRSLDENAGMLFKFEKPQNLRFWGLNTYIPLDIAFITGDGKISSIQRIKPMSMSAVASDDKCVIAIEANEGYFHKNGVSEGDAIEIDKDNDGFHVVKFKR